MSPNSPAGLVLIGLLGVAVGSFVDVVASRVLAGGTLMGRSRCPACGHVLGGVELVPVVSWIALRGRCRHCRGAIGWAVPVVELGCGALFVALAVRFGDSAALVGYLIAGAGLLAVALADLRGSGIPLVILLPVSAAVVVALAVAAVIDHDWEPLVRALTAGGVAGTAGVLGRLALPATLRPEHAVLAALLGVLAGWVSWAAAGAGALVGAGLVAATRLVADPRPTPPLVAPLALGVLVAVLMPL